MANAVSRRALVKLAGIAALAGRADAGPGSGKTIGLGGPVFVKSTDPAVIAKAHQDVGYRAAYAPADLSVSDTVRIAAMAREFASRDVTIAEVGAWKNMLDPNPETRRQNIGYVTDRLALAEALGARNCV